MERITGTEMCNNKIWLLHVVGGHERPSFIFKLIVRTWMLTLLNCCKIFDKVKNVEQDLSKSDRKLKLL